MPGWLLVLLGGALGSLARYGMTLGIASGLQVFLPSALSAYPLGTLTVNLLGCLSIGLLIGVSGGFNATPGESMRLFLMVGFLGGFTTFSSYALELARLLNTGTPSDIARAGLYLLLSNLLGIGLALGGNWVGNRLQS